jgi:hypothetical protein
MKIQYKKYINVDQHTFGYKWVKTDSNYRQLFLGKSGKGYCISITYDKTEKVAFKDNSGYFRSCNEENNLPRGKEGTYKMIYASVYAVLERYPDAKILEWQDNTMITLNNRYDVSLSDSDTILYGRPRLLDVIGDESLLDKRDIGVSELILLKLERQDMDPVKTFFNRFYKGILPENVVGEVKGIYNKSKTLLEFFKKADSYLAGQGMKKLIFIPLNDIFTAYSIATHVGMKWTFDIKRALNSAKNSIEIEMEQVGGSLTVFDVKLPKIKFFKRDASWGGGDYIVINGSCHFLEPLRKYETLR